MPISARNLRIGGASLIAVILVAGGYLLPGAQFPKTKLVSADLTDELLAAYIAKDTDGDGLPDWQEALYGTDPNVADTDGDGVTDGEAVRQGLLTPTSLASQLPTDPIGEEDIPGSPPAPGSFTEQFARTFFEAYVRASGGQPMSEEKKQALTTDLLGRFTSEAARSLNSSYTIVSVRTDANLSATLYTGRVENAINSSIPDVPNSDMFILAQRLTESGDSTASNRLNELGDQYIRAATSLLSVSAPPSLAGSHLSLIRGFEQAGKAAKAISAYEEDPLLTMGALSMLLPSRAEIMRAFAEIAQGVLREGEPAIGAPGAEIVDVVRQEQQR